MAKAIAVLVLLLLACFMVVSVFQERGRNSSDNKAQPKHGSRNRTSGTTGRSASSGADSER